MKNKIVIDTDHPDRERVEHFLNSLNGTLERVPFDWQDWKHAEGIVTGVRLKGKNSSLTITVIFATSYFDATEIEEANSLSKIVNARSGVNGDVLYLVESSDEDTLSDVVSTFAGKE